MSEKLIDELYKVSDEETKLRTYRQKARKNYLMLVRNKRPGQHLIRKTLKSQLQYLRRNLGHIKELAEASNLTPRQQAGLVVIQEVYCQQKQMYNTHRHTVENRIVSVSQL